MNNLGMRRKKYRRTWRRRRRRQRGGGKKKAADKTRKLVKNARMRAREKTRKAREETRKFDEMMELFGYNNSNEFSYSNEYSSENDTPKKTSRWIYLLFLLLAVGSSFYLYYQLANYNYSIYLSKLLHRNLDCY